uniref:Endonuclease/exonuclease/phosphatase domain-containing protein n=1 Tax=Dendroctonus ponderosae TaxID=77166 RepID=A0AAR5P2Q3_DENPD
MLKPGDRFTLRNYQTHRADRPTRGGGTLVAVKRSIQHHEIVKPSANLEESIVAVQMEKSEIRVGSVYVSPSATLCPEDVQRLFPDDRPMIHGGDFNAKNTNWGCNFNNARGNMLSNEARKNLFEIAAPQEPTHIAQNGRDDILDIFLYKNAGRLSSPEVLQELSSDHLP